MYISGDNSEISMTCILMMKFSALKYEDNSGRNKIKLVYGPFGQSNMPSTLDFCPRPTREETNVPLDKRSYELTVLIYTVTYTKKQFTYKKK